MQNSKYASAVPAILAEMEQQRQEDERAAQPDQAGETVEKMFVYRTDTGGWLISPSKLQEKEPETSEDGQPQPPIIESQEPDAQPTTKREPPYFLHFLLLLFLFIGLDNVDMVLAQLAPTASVTIRPVVKTITTSATFPIGPGEVQGRVFPALTLSQSETVQATGKGHQDAQYASGTLTFYNGSFTAQTIIAGTVYTGADGVQVATDHTVTIPAANPPYLGQATVSATAIHAGASGNIQAGDISITTSTLQVRNSQFSGGQDARDFTYVTKGDIQHASYALTSLLLQSEQGVLSGQLQPGETLTTPTCTPSVLSTHHPGDEAASVEVTVSETCRAIAYSQQSLQQAALRLVQGNLNSSYQLIGAIQITIRSITLQNSSASMSATIHGVWAYQINEEQIQSLVAGKPRLTAIQLLQKLPGIEKISITGIADNSPLPDDLSHIHILILVEG